MEINSFIQNFANIFDETDSSLISPDTNFRDLDEWGSLIALTLIAMVDDEYSVRLSGDDITSSNTINDLFIKISSKM
jgi:acyl carrier protein